MTFGGHMLFGRVVKFSPERSIIINIQGQIVIIYNITLTQVTMEKMNAFNKGKTANNELKYIK